MACAEDGWEPLPVVAGELSSAIVAISSLVTADSPRRSGENPEHARMLAELADRLPPIVVHRPTMRVIDGMHRLRAALLRGEQHIQVQYFDGNEASAFVLAVRLNVAHGLPLSLGDRKAAADRILSSYPRWSDRGIASVTGLSAPTVAARRRRLTVKSSQSDTRLGMDGRIRPVDPAGRRDAAARLLASDPPPSLRAVSRQTGLSPETVRRVRARLDPSGPPTAERARAHREFSAVQALLADPAFRSTESGRMLLRLLAASRALQERGSELLENIPAHSLGRLAEAGRECVREWQAFTVEAERRLGHHDKNGPG